MLVPYNDSDLTNEDNEGTALVSPFGTWNRDHVNGPLSNACG